jgi:hypothetical protein
MLYDKLESKDVIQSMTHHEYEIYLYEMAKIKRILIDNPFGKPQMKIAFTTNICHKEVLLLADFQRHLFETIEEHAPQSTYYINVRHNSPLHIELIISDTTVQLIHYSTLLIGSLFSATLGVVTMIEKIKKIKNIDIDTKNKKLDLEIKQKQLNQSNTNNTEDNIMLDKSALLAKIGNRVISMNITINSESEIPAELRYIELKNENLSIK